MIIQLDTWKSAIKKNIFEHNTDMQSYWCDNGNQLFTCSPLGSILWSVKDALLVDEWVKVLETKEDVTPIASWDNQMHSIIHKGYVKIWGKQARMEITNFEHFEQDFDCCDQLQI